VYNQEVTKQGSTVGDDPATAFATANAVADAELESAIGRALTMGLSGTAETLAAQLHQRQLDRAGAVDLDTRRKR
jgi:hypothetical protein